MNQYPNRPHRWAFLWLLLAGSLGTGCSELLSPDISDREVVLISPGDSLYTAEGSLSLWWEADEQVEQWHLRVTKGPANNLSLVMDSTFVGTQADLAFSTEGNYHWEVNGVNEGSETEAATRDFFVDWTAPEKATALQLDGDTVTSSGGGTLSWASSDYPLAGTLHAVSDSLLLYRRNDSTIVGARYAYGPGDARLLAIDGSGPAPMNGPGAYYWRVVTLDAAGNRRVSDLFRFWIQ